MPVRGLATCGAPGAAGGVRSTVTSNARSSLRPPRSVAVIRTVYVPSATLSLDHASAPAHVPLPRRAGAASVPSAVHDDVPAGAISQRNDTTPVLSVAVAVRLTSPLRMVPWAGVWLLTNGAVVSARAVAVAVAEGSLGLPRPSTATTR